jgi:hypothetical protein
MKPVLTPQWLIEKIADDLRKLDSGSADLDVARTQQSHHKHLIRLFDEQLQALRVYVRLEKSAPAGWTPQE